MADQRPPHDPPESDDADAIIELTDIVSSPEADGDAIIDLTDVVAGVDAEDDDVIDLTEVVASSLPQAPAAQAISVEEAVIELTDLATGDDALLPASAEEAEESTSGELEFADMDLDIESGKEEVLFDSVGMNMEADLLRAEDTGELDFNLSTQELSDAIDLLDAKLAEEPSKPPPADMGGVRPPASLDQNQLEAALENVIRKMFGEKIDQLLNEAIEKTVSAEIAHLKDQLLGDTPETS